MRTHVHPHRLFVSGGSQLSAPAALLWNELGRRLASESGLVVVTGGLLRRRDSPRKKPADWAIVEGVLAGLERNGVPPRDRIETVLPDGAKDWDEVERFHVGQVRIQEHRNSQSRRFSMVNESEVVISIEGNKGTRSVLDVALAIERPILPLPFGGKASAEFWDVHRSEICRWFKIPKASAKRFERTKLKDLDPVRIRTLAAEVHKIVMNGFARSCFVIMPFQRHHDAVYEDAICPALDAHGLHPVRTDKHIVTGNVIAAIREGLQHCYFTIADTTGNRPNVLYELGMAHGMGKPAILLRRQERKKGDAAPFDIRVEQMLSYPGRNMGKLRRRLIDAIARLRGKKAERKRRKRA
jgi:hypothetical protein